MKKVNGRHFLSDLKFYTDYSKWRDEDGRYETWEEACESVMNTHREKYKDIDGVKDLIDEAENFYKEKFVLASQRNLQFRGEQIFNKNERMFNCFEKNTEFITSEGVKSFNDFEYGDSCIVPTHTGSWKNAVVKKYGVQKLFRVTFSKGSRKEDVLVTKDHRWLLRKGVETTNLTIGDKILRPKNIFQDFNWETASIEEKIYWCYGLIYGDGTKVVSKNNTCTYSMIRLCGNNSKFEERFKELGFKSTRPLSIAGDVMVYTGKYLKTTLMANPSIDPPELIRAFVHGYLEADGEKNRNKTGKKFLSIQSSEVEHIDFIRKCFPVAGVFINNETDLTGQKTNHGTRPYTIKFHLTEGTNGSTDQHWVVTNIVEEKEDEVWCLEVEDDRSFILNQGIVTGNCATAYMDKIETIHKAFFLTLCGCGVGVNMMKKWTDKLPNLVHRNKDITKNYIIDDSIEGWADAAGVLISSYCDGDVPFPEYQNCIVRLDYSNIRPKGAFISGGFKAPGPDGLKQSLERIEQLFEMELLLNKKMRPIVAYDVLMHLADATLSGGVRRSAVSIIVDPTDEEMIKAKTGNWREENPQRGRSNNSVGLYRGKFSYEEFADLVKLNNGMSDIGFVFLNNDYESFNPCQPSYAKVITPDGIREFKDISEGSIIWSKEGWTKVVKKWSTGVKSVYKYQTTAGIFYGTENHQIVQNGEKIEVKDAESIDIIRGKGDSSYIIDAQDVMDGLVIGDGSVHKASNNLVVLHIGKDDTDYFTSEIKDCILKHRTGIHETAYSVITTISSEELPKTYERKVPERFIKDPNKLVGFLRGVFSANGSVCENRITLKTTSKNILEDVQLMLNSIGIKSYYTTNKSSNVKFKNGEYICKESYDLNITSDRDIFMNTIGFIQEYKTDKVKNVNGSKTKCSHEIIHKEYIGDEEVFDITVDNDTHTYWTQGCDVSNCFEIGFTPILDVEKEITGFAFCNLVEINAKACMKDDKLDVDKFYDACRVASTIATLQAGYIDYPYMGKITEEIVKNESLIGVGITGWMDNPELFNEEILEMGASIVIDTNKKVSKLIGINSAARTTTVKPSGNSSTILGCASGIHPEHSMRYFRNMQLNKESDTAKWLEDNMPEVLEESLYSATNTDYVVSSPIENSASSIFKNDISSIEHLEKIKLVQRHWVKAGKVKERCLMKDTMNNVSCTIIIDDYDEVARYVYDNQNDFTAVSFLSDFGDKDYYQAPFTSVLTSDELIKKYGDGVIFASGLIVDGLHAFDDNLWDACDYILNRDKKLEGTRQSVFLKKDWLRRARKFSKNYFGNDAKKMIYCLKDVHLSKKWHDINRAFKPVNFEEMLIKPVFNDVSNYTAQACAGGACEIL